MARISMRDPEPHDTELNQLWVAGLRTRSSNYLLEKRTEFETELRAPTMRVHQRTIKALALTEVLKEIDRRTPQWQAEHNEALVTLLAQPNLSEEMRAWARIELGYDKL